MNTMRERRRYTRQPLRLTVWLIAPDRTAHSGTARNYSLGGRGLFVACPRLAQQRPAEAEGRIVAGDDIELCCSVPVSGGVANVRVNARVAGLFDGGLGMELTNPEVELLVALQDMANRTRKFTHVLGQGN
ncbi:MAG: hypothetical protein GWN37_14170 [Gammaproteobacteria bacterium]|nr:hypothetical protein [Gammaproteobacteria bacterium]